MSLPELEAAVARLPTADLQEFSQWFGDFQAGSADRQTDAVPSAYSVRTGADLVAYWQTEGLIGTRPDIVDGPDHARRLREQAQRRRA